MATSTKISKVDAGSRKIREIPANADVAQLVEHFTRNEGVPGSSPGVGFGKGPKNRGFPFLGSPADLERRFAEQARQGSSRVLALVLSAIRY